MYVDGRLMDYIDDAASSKPAPGGGSVSAMVGALGTTMGSMAANFTIGKKKFAGVEGEVKGLLARIDAARAKLLALVDADVAAYGEVGAAYSMPKETEGEKLARSAAIKSACGSAMGVPRRIMAESLEVLRALSRLVDIANPNLISDVGVAAIFARAALEGGRLNVEINLKSLAGDPAAAGVAEEVAERSAEAARLEDDVLRKVRTAIGG